MPGFTMRFAFLSCVCLLIAAAVIGCDDEKKTVCCECTCFAIDGTSGDDLIEVDTVQGENINCRSSCEDFCAYNDNFKGYELESSKRIDCPADTTKN
jgi:hypothetical protein